MCVRGMNIFDVWLSVCPVTGLVWATSDTNVIKHCTLLPDAVLMFPAVIQLLLCLSAAFRTRTKK